eukprot:568462-Pyramimonas_sp.AAC.1
MRPPHSVCTALRGPIGSSTEGPGGGARMRPPHPVQRFVAPWGLHRRPQWATLSTALRGPVGSPTEGPSGTARMRPPQP